MGTRAREGEHSHLQGGPKLGCPSRQVRPPPLLPPRRCEPATAAAALAQARRRRWAERGQRKRASPLPPRALALMEGLQLLAAPAAPPHAQQARRKAEWLPPVRL